MEKSSESINLNLERKKVCNISKINNFDELDDIRAIGDSEKIEMGDCLLLRKNKNITTYSYGAGPCVSGVIQTNDNKLYMFHSVADELTQEQEEVVKNVKNGIVGGGKESLNILKSKFKNKNIKIISSPPEGGYDFNIVFVKSENQFNVSPGIYFCYDHTEDTNQ
jgi:hypothetical protein